MQTKSGADPPHPAIRDVECRDMMSGGVQRQTEGLSGRDVPRHAVGVGDAELGPDKDPVWIGGVGGVGQDPGDVADGQAIGGAELRVPAAARRLPERDAPIGGGPTKSVARDRDELDVVGLGNSVDEDLSVILAQPVVGRREKQVAVRPVAQGTVIVGRVRSW